jgi:hypothetical protein
LFFRNTYGASEEPRPFPADSNQSDLELTHHHFSGNIDRTGYDGCMRSKLRFLWNTTRGHRLAPWRSPYLLWRIETYTGVKMTQIGFLEFWEFIWRERRELWLFLKWTGEMERYVHPKPKRS